MSFLKRQSPSTPATMGFQGEMQRMFDHFFNDRLTHWDWPRNEQIFPSVSVKDADKAFIITAELPGIERQDLDITVQDNHVILKGEKREETQEKDENYIRRERSYGAFMRQIPLSSSVDAEHAEARLDKGILTLKLPKLAQSNRKAIPIK